MATDCARRPAQSPPTRTHRNETTVNSLFVLMGIESWKPVLTALLLPPVPFLLLTLVGARLILPRRGWGWTLIVLSVAGLWLSNCIGTALRIGYSSGEHGGSAITSSHFAAIS